MRYLLLLALLIAGAATYAQEISTEQQNILAQYDLNPQDHRGIEFQLASASNPAQYPTIQSAIEGFFTTAVKKDYTVLTVSSGDPQYLNTPFGILDLVNMYINLSNN
jgi:hypothetical protein